MPKISSGIGRIGGKFRLTNTLLKFVPYHEFFLSPFCGACWLELNKPRCRYECFNDVDAELINYFLVIREYPKEFDELKQGVFGLVSQEICNRIVRGELKPKDNIERAYFFYYLNKLTFGGSVQKGNSGLIDNHNLSREGYGRVDSKVVENAKEEFEWKTKGYLGILTPDVPRDNEINKIKNEWKTKGFGGIINNRAIPQNTLHDNDFQDIKQESPYRGVILPTVCKDKSINEAKSNYGGLIDCGNSGGSGFGKVPRKRDMHIYKKSYKNAQIKGINPKTTRPYTNNDCGLLSPLQPEAIKHLRYVNLTCYPFQKVYKLFYEAFHVRKGLEKECFLYCDPPYPGTEKYYQNLFTEENHLELIKIVKETPFHIMLSIGGECELYLKELAHLNIVPVKVKYSTDANSQTDKNEFIIMNYDINELPLMISESEQNTMEGWLK